MSDNYDVFIGSYGTEAEQTIHWLHFDAAQVSLTSVTSVAGIENPSFVLLNNAKTHLYAVSEVAEGQVVSYEIDYINKALIELNRQPTKGGPCFIEIDATDSFIMTANYGGGSFIVHPLAENGEIEAYSDFVDYGPAAREKGLTSHAHAIKNISGTNTYVATDLGLDKLYIYTLSEAGKLEAQGEIETPTGAGPRHLAFREDLQTMYVLNQNDSTVMTYTYDLARNQFERRQILPTLLEPFDGTNYCADIHLSGDYLYVSNRGHHSLTVYSILGNGELREMSNVTSAGEWPRGFNTVPNAPYLIVANEHTDELIVMMITKDGSLKQMKNKFKIKKPVWLDITIKPYE